ncbi:MAG: right-handed parallel beta-helix repeat-containing protein [Fuerstiella sp.]|nr:right-handed parallel beta-helix repeat-containing protein [Fuerstiella sp.]
MTSRDEIIEPPAPVPLAGEDLNAGDQNAPAQIPIPENGPPPANNGNAGNTAPRNQGGPGANFTPPTNFTPYLEQSFGATESPVLGRRVVNNPLFGPQLMFESNVGEGLGFNESYQRLNARIPYHVVPGNSVLIGDLSASLTNDRGEAYNFGLIWRNYDATRNRVFGWNVYGDVDDGRQNNRWQRFGVGMESLGKYIDFFANGYFVSGTDSVLLSSSLGTDLSLGGNSAFRTRTSTWDNAYSGGDFEVGGPLPLLGRRGINAYAGGYYLDNDQGYETFGYSARVQALITESATVDLRYTGDDTFGDNLWVSLAYTIPNYRERAIMQPKRVRDRLADPVYRSNRIHTNIDVVDTAEAMFNAAKGRAFNLIYVDPDATSTTAGGDGAGTLEDPFTSLMVAAMNNNAGIDVINVNPRDDDSNTNLTVNGGLALFDCQVLRSTTEAHTLDTIAGTNFIIPAVATGTGLGASIANPTMAVGGSVVRLSNENTVLGMRIDASNTAMTVFGTGITNPLPFTDATIVRNTFTNYGPTTAVNLIDGSGTIILDENTATGLSGASMSGLVLTTAAGSTTELLIRNNTVSDNAIVGIGVTAGLNSTINADHPTGIGPGGTSVQTTGIIGNTVTNGGEGIVVAGQAGSTINAVVEDNTSTGNTNNGFVGRADGSTFNLLSMANNTFSSNLENGALIHYVNGGLFSAITEDLNGDGVIDPGEDLNGNGLLDQGIVSNTMNNNSIAGMCLFGQDTATGVFDIGGPDASLGNTFIGNAAAGVAVDLQDSATAQIDALFNTVQGGNATPGLTIVLDFVDPAQGPVVDGNGRTVNPFDVTPYGFAATDFDTVTNAIAQTIQSYYRGIPTAAQDSRSSIPDGMQLDLDFVIGDAGVAPSNGATEYYAVTLGDSAANLGGLAGQAADIGNIRNATGQGPGQGLGGVPLALGASAAGIYTNGINQFSPLLSPPTAFIGPSFPEPIIVEAPSQTPQFAIDALTSGNVTFTRRAIGLIAAHELGHSLSLRHIQQTGAVTPSGLNAIMGTPAIDSPIQSLLEPAEFAFSGTNPGEIPGEAPFVANSIDQLVSAIGVRVAAAETRNGFTVSGTDNARLIASTFNNNTITGASEHGINIDMQDNAVAEGVTIQSNAITNGAGHGIRLNADGPGAFIDADTTIGGTGSNTYRGNVFLQGNNISTNTGDGFRAIAANGGIIHGNLLNNQITNNGGNGATLSIDGSGTIDFGTPALNRIISGNTITGNTGSGIETVSTVTATGTGLLDAVIQNNTISNNTAGGIASRMFGPNMFGVTNNVINMTVGGTTAQANTIDGNGNVGISFSVAGNGKGNFTMSNATVNNSVDGPEVLTNGDGIFLQRVDSSLLTANITNVTATGNAGDGLAVDVQGNDKSDPNQPMSGTVNTVTWNNNDFSRNGGNGARFITRGDAQLVADGENNVLSNNTAHGILINSSETSTFGDATDGLPPGRRVLLNGTTASNNGQDGINVNAIENSRVLLEITSNRTAATSVGAHASLNTNGDTNISNNGGDGIDITTTGGTSDILITAGTGSTTIDGNGTVGGGNGIRWDASGTADGIVRVTRTTITNSLAGVSEDANGNGVLDPGEDGSLTGIQNGNINSDIDVTDGEGIQYNVTGLATATLVVGGIGAGNVIQNNADDGIEIATQGSGLTTSRPVISIVENTIGGENNGLEAGNGGDGMSLNVIGGINDASTIGGDPPNVDSSVPPADTDGLSPFPGDQGVQENGPIVQLTVSDNLVSNNNRRGANLLITGAAGERDREGAVLIDPLRITFTGNNISSNGEEGMFFQGDTNMNQSRLTYLANFPFPDPPFNPADQRPQTFGFYTPTQPEFLNSNIGTVNGNTAFSPTAPDGAFGYLNLRTVQNTQLTVTGNIIQNNGVNTVTGEGLVLRVGTSAYVAATVNNNIFGGNLEEDLRTESFLSFDGDNGNGVGNTFPSIDNTGDGTFDVIYWDDTAQLDMTFQNNSGNQILLSSNGATYTDSDLLKSAALGAVGVTDRDAGFFQVDNGPNLDNPNNTFINFGATQDIDGAFINGGFNLRAIADPAFPNIGFAPFLP